MPPIAAYVTYAVQPGKRDEFLAALDRMRPVIDADPGTLVHVIHTSSKDPNTVWIYELYEDHESAVRHAEQVQPYQDALGALAVGEMQIEHGPPVRVKGAALPARPLD